MESISDMIRIRILDRLHWHLDRGETQVGIREMLDLLDPNYAPPAQAPQDPRADPLTGCLPVVADAQPPA